MIIAQLLRYMRGETKDERKNAAGGQDQGSFEGFDSNENDRKKVLYLIQIHATLSPMLRHYLNSVKLALLMSKCPLRLVIIEGEKCIAGREPLPRLSKAAECLSH